MPRRPGLTGPLSTGAGTAAAGEVLPGEVGAGAAGAVGEVAAPASGAESVSILLCFFLSSVGNILEWIHS